MIARSLIPATGDSLGVTVIVLDAVFLSLAAVALALRIWARRIKQIPLCFNDYALLAAWPFTAGLIVTAVMAVVPGGAGQHMEDVDPSGLPSVLRVEIIVQPIRSKADLLPQGYVAADLLWVIANTLIKLSILHLYVQIFDLPRFRKYAIAVAILVLCFFAGVVLMQFLLCRPLAKTWDQTLPGTCGDSIKSVLATSIINVSIDLMMITLPMPVLWRLHMPTKKKIMLSIVFGLGLVICVITAMRIVASAQFDPLDFTYGLAKLAIWTDLEPTLGMVNACMPIIQPALRRIMGTGDSQDSGRTAMSSSVRRLRTKSTNPLSKYKRFDDSYLMTDRGTETTIEHHPSAGSLNENLASLPDSIPSAGNRSAIQVRNEWNVHSE